MNSITSYDYLAQYLSYSATSQSTNSNTSTSSTAEMFELAMSYSTNDVDTFELSKEGKELSTSQAAMQKLYDVTMAKVEAALGTDAAEAPTSATSELTDYFSPENTAQRIVDFAASFFGSYQTNHADDADSSATVDNFKQLMSDAINQGFAEALGMLNGATDNELPSYVNDTISQTYDLVQEKLAALNLA